MQNTSFTVQKALIVGARLEDQAVGKMLYMFIGSGSIFGWLLYISSYGIVLDSIKGGLMGALLGFIWLLFLLDTSSTSKKVQQLTPAEYDRLVSKVHSLLLTIVHDSEKSIPLTTDDDYHAVYAFIKNNVK